MRKRKSSTATVAARKPRQKKKPKISRRKQNESTLGCNGKKKKKASTRPTTLQDENGQDVWIATATLADIARTRRTKKPPFSKNRIYLYNVPAANQRHECYERAAAAWQDMEQSLLPKYGNRSWQVVVRITDPTPSSSSSKATKKTALPYFVFGKRTGLLELAAWPHLLLKIPNAPRFPGFDQKVKSVPPEAVKRQPKKQQPQQEEEVEEEAHIEEEEEEDPQQEEEVEEEAHIEEEEEKEEEAASDAEEEEQRSEVASEDGEEQVDEQSQGGEEEDSDDQEEEESEESEGDDDESNDDDEEEEEEEELLDHDIADLQNERCVTPLSTLAWELRMQVPLPNITIKWISPLLESFTSRTSAWDRAVQLARNEVFLDRTLLGLDTATGKQVPLGVSNNKNESSDNNGKKNSKSSVTASNCSVISKRVALKAGKLRFERDGLWVVGQEEEWQQRRWNNEMETTSTITVEEDKESSTCPASSGDGGGDSGGAGTKRKLTSLTLYLQCNRKTHQAKRVAEMTALSANEEQQVQFTLRQAETELRSMWKNELTEDERQEWGRRAAAAATTTVTVTSTATIGDATSVMVPPSDYEQEKEEDSRKLPPGTLNTTVVATTNTNDPMTTSTTTVCVTPTSSEALEKVTTATLDGAESAASCSAARRRLVVSPEEPSMLTALAASSSTGMDVATMHSPPSSIPSNVAPSGNLFVPSTHWRLNAEQIRLCYNAGIEHYESVMATVMARGLNRELQDGFDVLRERGRGRFDMELPVFDTPAFRFLTDLKKAPWMPIVRQILGKEVALIHKGMFLSLPGAETQEYHQDGVHLNTQYQKPCHAINVFIPLIDLTLKSGPTEFCLGSHFLGQEEYNRDFLETPLVKAGTPVIFDYRLGHKGMCNQSNECRPIVYCTYAPVTGGSEFRDSVNFSRKRYHRIGDLVRQGPTREERARKRKLFAEEQVEQERILDTNVQSARETAQTESKSTRVSSRNSKRKQDM